jgi:hypothetical protein
MSAIFEIVDQKNHILNYSQIPLSIDDLVLLF